MNRDERGSALIAVVGVMAVTVILAVTIIAATTNAISVTTSTRASVQALAAAEAGISVAVTNLQTAGACVVGANGAMTFAAVSGVTIDSIVVKPDNKTGCPDAASTSVVITSTGKAANAGVGASSGNSAKVESTYAYGPIIVQVPLAGVAVYAHEVDGTLKKFQLTSADNSVATSVMIKTGDVECTNNASIAGDLVLGDGNAVMDMCDVLGSVHVSGNATINKSKVGGDVKARGTATVTNSTVGGTVRSGSTVPIPVVPNWVDVGFPGRWAANGYTIVNWTGSCSISKNNAQWQALKNYTTPTVVNFMSACPNTSVTTSNNMDTVAVNTNLVFVAHQFLFDKLYFTAAASRTLSFIVPDQVEDRARTCAPPAGLTGLINLTNEANFSPSIAAMVYTPCKVYSDRNGFRGQIYGGEIEFGQQAQLAFVPVGIPGFDLTDGVTVPQTTGARLGDLVSRREIPNGP